MLVSEFELHFSYFILFRKNTHGKGKEPSYYPLYGLNNIITSTRIDLALYNQWSLICHLAKKFLTVYFMFFSFLLLLKCQPLRIDWKKEIATYFAVLRNTMYEDH